MGLLWTIEDCHRWAQIHHSEVRLWVANRLEDFFSKEAGPIMASLLEDKDENVARRAASYFMRWPDPKFPDPLLHAFQTKKGRLLDSCAQALAKMGDDRFVPIFFERYGAKSIKLLDHPGILLAMMELKRPEGIWMIHQLLEKLPEARKDDKEENVEDLVYLCASSLLRCHQPEEIVFLLGYFLTSSRREDWGYLILEAFVDYANAPYSREDLEQESQKRIFSRLSALERDEIALVRINQGRGSAQIIESFLKKKKYIELVSFLHREAEAIFDLAGQVTGEVAMEEWEKRESQPLINLLLLRALADEIPLIEKAESTVQRRLAITSLIIYTQLLDYREFIGRSPEKMMPDERARLLLEDREDITEDEELIELLSKGEPPPELIQACRKKIEDDACSPAAVRAVRLLGQLRTSEAIPALLSALYHDDDYLSEAAEDALCEMGEAVLPYIEPILQQGSDDDVVCILPLLGRLPYQGTVEMILSHFERLHQINREALVYSIEELGSRRFIPLLKEYLTEDEPEEEVFSLLCWLHEIHDPELPRIERALSQHKKEDEQRLARLQAGDEMAFIRETIPLPLRCLQCRRTYTYSVSEVIVDREDEEMREVYIRDPIICKYCGAQSQYEITLKARLAITASLAVMVELADAGKADLNQGPVKLATLMVGGKPMNPKQGLAYYQKEIAKHPSRADLRVGYGNLLLFWKREEEARAEFEKAVDLDPLAIEALHSLAQMEIKSGRFDEGYIFYQRCFKSFDEGHFYRMDDEKREQFREHLEVNLWELQKKLGLRPSPTQDLSGILQEPIIRKEKTGRNDPCPCGSGKKYKRCCLGQEEARLHVSAPKTMVTEEEGRLTERLVAFATSPRLRKDFKEASSLFFFKPISELPEYSDEDPVFTQFIEWFIHDFALTGGTTVIKEFARTQGRSVSAKEREILDGWIDPAISLYEVQESHPERAEVQLKDLFTGESFLVRDVSGSQRLVKWDLIGARVLRLGEEFRLSGVISYFLPRERASLVRFFTEKWEEYRKETGEEHWESFMKARGYLLYHYSLLRGEEVMPPLLTPENHEMVFCKAIYDVENFGGVIFRLKQEYDFQLGEEGQEAAGQKNVQFSWLKRGKSKDIIPEGPKREQGLVIQAAVLPSPESRGTLSLGTLTVTQSRLTLEVMSRERLAAGKRRVEGLLGRYIRFRLDTFESVKAALKRHEGHEEKEDALDIPVEEQEVVMRNLLARHTDQWIDTPIPALDGKTPLEMVALPGGKERVGQLLKEMENTEERKRRAGEFYVDVNALRKRLGFPLS